MSVIAGHWHSWAVIALMMIGLYTVIARDNLIKKLLGLSIFQVAAIMFYITIGKVEGGTAPILVEGKPDTIYTNPLPHVLMLTAIVVGIATMSVALAIVVRIQEAYGTVEEDELVALDHADDAAAARPAEEVAS